MKTAVRRAIAATTICAAVTSAVAISPLAAAEPNQAKQGREASDFGYKGTAVGARLISGNVEHLHARQAAAPLRCTRMTGRDIAPNPVPLEVPEDSLISVGDTVSRTVSYRQAGKHGVRAVNNLGDISLGGTIGGVLTPVVSFGGLTIGSDAFHTARGYGTKETIDYDSFAIEMNGQEVPPELDPLLDALDPVTGGVGQVIDVLEQAAGPIEIPSLGTIALNGSKSKVTRYGAESSASGFEFLVDATGTPERLLLGSSRAVIGGPTPSGVFRSTSMPLAVSALNDTLRFGAVKPRTIPCAGTRGKVKERHLDSASIGIGESLIDVTDINYTFMGLQRPNGTAKGFDAQQIGTVEIPAAKLVIHDIVARSSARLTKAGRHKSGHRSSVGQILYDGQPFALQGNETQLPGGEGWIERDVIASHGTRVTALRIYLTQVDAVVDLGIAASRVFAY